MRGVVAFWGLPEQKSNRLKTALTKTRHSSITPRLQHIQFSHRKHAEVKMIIRASKRMLVCCVFKDPHPPLYCEYIF